MQISGGNPVEKTRHIHPSHSFSETEERKSDLRVPKRQLEQSFSENQASKYLNCLD